MATRLDSIYRATLGRKLHHSNSNSYHRMYLRIFMIANWIRMQHLLHGACILPLSYKEDALCVGLMMASRVQRLFSGIWPLTSRRKTVLDGSVLHGADWQAESNASFIRRSLATLSAMTMVWRYECFPQYPHVHGSTSRWDSIYSSIVHNKHIDIVSGPNIATKGHFY